MASVTRCYQIRVNASANQPLDKITSTHGTSAVVDQASRVVAQRHRLALHPSADLQEEVHLLVLLAAAEAYRDRVAEQSAVGLAEGARKDRKAAGGPAVAVVAGEAIGKVSCWPSCQTVEWSEEMNAQTDLYFAGSMDW